MKKIFNTLLLTLAIIGMASCSDNGEGSYTDSNSIKVVSQTVSDMSVKASEGTIVVEAPSKVEAIASTDWFTASVNGNTITVKTTDNLGIDYRSGKVVIKSGSDAIDVAVIQKGTIVSIDVHDLYLNDADTLVGISYACNLDFKCYASEDWITCKADGENLSISIKENATGHMRSGYVFYEAGQSKDSIYVQQCELEKDLLGDVKFFFYDAKSQDYKNYNAEFVAAQDTAGVVSYALVLKQLGFVIPVSYNATTNSIVMKAGQYVGNYQEYYVFTVMYSAETGNMTTDSKAGMTGKFYYDKDDDATYLEFEDDGGWDESSATSLVLYAFDAEDKAVGALLTLHFPYLMK